jgi:hypothetical protein
MKDDPTEKHRRAAGGKLLEARNAIPPKQWESWCRTHIQLSFERIIILMDSIERIRASNRMHMAKQRAEPPADDSPKGESTETSVEEQDTEPMDFNELIQAGIDEGVRRGNDLLLDPLRPNLIIQRIDKAIPINEAVRAVAQTTLPTLLRNTASFPIRGNT